MILQADADRWGETVFPLSVVCLFGATVSLVDVRGVGGIFMWVHGRCGMWGGVAVGWVCMHGRGL